MDFQDAIRETQQAKLLMQTQQALREHEQLILGSRAQLDDQSSVQASLHNPDENTTIQGNTATNLGLEF